jgi:hypothetical protein
MFSFKGYSSSGTNTHLEHLEDSIINDGAKGGRNAIAFLKSLRKMLSASTSKKVNVTVKWDGAPAIISGTNPENGKFFVGTKSVFNKTPKINYTSADIARNHPGGVASKLQVALRELKKLGIRGIVQGDCLFTSEDKQVANIDGQSMITFTPNTITYAMPIDSPVGRQIARARFGIVFHTQYNGKTMNSLSASYGFVRGVRSGSVWVPSAQYKDASGSASFNKGEISKFNSMLRMAEGSLNKAAPLLNEFDSRDPISVGFRLKSYFNSIVRDSRGTIGSVKVLQQNFRSYYENFIDAEIDARKTAKGKAKFKDAKEMNLLFIDRNKPALYFAIASYITLQTCKNILLQKLAQIQSVGHFIRTNTGYRVTAPEGFVATDRVGNVVKLVDRLEFSRANFNVSKDWVKG